MSLTAERFAAAMSCAMHCHAHQGDDWPSPECDARGEVTQEIHASVLRGVQAVLRHRPALLIDGADYGAAIVILRSLVLSKPAGHGGLSRGCLCRWCKAERLVADAEARGIVEPLPPPGADDDDDGSPIRCGAFGGVVEPV